MVEPSMQNFDKPGNIPIPDPSKVTTEAIDRDVRALRELLQEKLDSLAMSNNQHREILETRFHGMDTAIELLQDIADKFPARIDEKIKALQGVTDQKIETIEEKFNSVQKQFDERDVRIEQAAGAVKIAVDAALQAQKEAAGEANRSSAASISKSEASFTKQIDLITGTIQTITKAFDDKIATAGNSATVAINDVKDRLNRFEGQGQGMSDMWKLIIGVVGLIATLAALGVFNRVAPAPVYVPAPTGTTVPVNPPTIP